MGEPYFGLVCKAMLSINFCIGAPYIIDRIRNSLSYGCTYIVKLLKYVGYETIYMYVYALSLSLSLSVSLFCCDV